MAKSIFDLALKTLVGNTVAATVKATQDKVKESVKTKSKSDAIAGATVTDPARDAAKNDAPAGYMKTGTGYEGYDKGDLLNYTPMGGGSTAPSYSGGSGFSYASAPSYASKYQRQIDDLTKELLGQKPFSYDYETDPLYQQYKDSYTRAGSRAMQDTLAQISARTGGLASSYATTASQQAYDNYMAGLNDKIPELHQLAYEMYLNDIGQKRDNLSMLTGLDNTSYGRYADRLSQYNADRNFAYGQYSDDWNRQYQVGRDAVSDARYSDETAYNRGIYADETAYDRQLQRAQVLAAAGDFSGFEALGYSPAQIAAMEVAYARQNAPVVGSPVRYGSKVDEGGDPGGVVNPDDGGVDPMEAEMLAQGYQKEVNEDGTVVWLPPLVDDDNGVNEGKIQDDKDKSFGKFYVEASLRNMYRQGLPEKLMLQTLRNAIVNKTITEREGKAIAVEYGWSNLLSNEDKFVRG